MDAALQVKFGFKSNAVKLSGIPVEGLSGIIEIDETQGLSKWLGGTASEKIAEHESCIQSFGEFSDAQIKSSKILQKWKKTDIGRKTVQFSWRMTRPTPRFDLYCHPTPALQSC